MAAIERTDHAYRLECEAIEAGGSHCPECGDTAPGDKLLVFYSVRGARWRQHDGAFCSQDCHDRWHGLKRRGDD